MMRIAHIVNPVAVGPESDLFAAQPVTFETMKIAREFARGKVDVQVLSAQYAEDRAVVPSWIQATPDLAGSVLDTGTFHKRRKLPLIKDILDRLYDASEGADYLVYTNVDIALMPAFYVAVGGLIEEGYDAMVINRRTVSRAHTSVEQIPLMYAENGRVHHGYDCFIFSRNSCRSFRTERVCIGVPWIGHALLLNLVCNSRKFGLFRDVHLTFHLGDDRSWKNRELEDYLGHNRREFEAILAHYRLENRPGVDTYAAAVSPRLSRRARAGRILRAIGRVAGLVQDS